MRMGDPTTPEGKKQLERQSPLYSAAKIKTPLLVVQGANDPRVKKAESDQIVIALRDRSFPVEYIVAPDEGHGFARPVNNMAMYAAIEKFLSKHLEGRLAGVHAAGRRQALEGDHRRSQDRHADQGRQPDGRQGAGAGAAAGNRRPPATPSRSALGGQSMKMESTNTVAEQGDTSSSRKR